MRKTIAKPFNNGLSINLDQLEGPLATAVFYLLFVLVTLFMLSNLSYGLLEVKIPRPNQIVSGPAHIYGPALLKEIQKPSYHFERVHYEKKNFGGVHLDRISELSKDQFEALLLNSVPKNLRQRFSLYIPIALGMAEKYQVDPFWVISVMWTESHFDVYARSHVNAMGLMQVLPETGLFLSRKLNRPVTKEYAHQMIQHPRFNIEMGVYFLGRLREKFGNTRLATVAYNMGPSRVRRRMAMGLPVGVRNNYLNKVKGHYRLLTLEFKKQVMSKPRPYEMTYVVAERPMTFIDKLVAIDSKSNTALPLLAKSQSLFSKTYL
ncbi:MAG: lytic transglycosylase domain-containing protein [Deltaproteobacteria bacterium]|nr:MAG: lytic transglycosylase domain-containing protein [Deltaproteobacteria bacterium]